jgi:hypothetical protein
LITCIRCATISDMKRQTRAMHVATTRRQYKDKVYETHLLRHSYREHGHVKHRTIANISHLPEHAREALRRALRGESLMSPEDVFEILHSRSHGHVAAVLGTLRQLGLERLIATRGSRSRDLAVALLVARVLDPASKLSTARNLHPQTMRNSLADTLAITGADEDDLYAAMDWLLRQQNKVERALARRHLDEGVLALYDLTSAHFEGRTCPLARLGFAHDDHRGKLQIVIGLLTNADGCPVAVEVFPGNTADPSTVASQIHKLQHQFQLSKVVLVGDRGTLTSARLCEDVKPANLDWITALRSPAIRKLVQKKSIQLSLFDDTDMAEITDPDFPGERLIVCRNPLLAEERARKRNELLQATEQKLDKIVAAVRRQRRPLRGKDLIGLRVGAVKGKFKVAKHFSFDIGEDHFHYQRNSDRIAEETALDGLYVIRTNVAAEILTPESTVQAYKGLSVVERAFRCLKTVDLKVRPIYHRLADRVRSHVFVCMLAYYVEWHMRQKLAPLLFDDDDPEAKQAQRSSVVAPAERSPKALKKAQTKKTDDGWPVQSFSDMLGCLATICKDHIRPKVPGGVPFDMVTTPSPLQTRAFELLGVDPNKM